MLSAEEKAQVEAQVALSKSLAFGVALSLVTAAGIGSAAAIWIGFRARGKIKASNGRLAGSGMSAWCIVAGAIGLIANVLIVWPMFFRHR